MVSENSSFSQSPSPAADDSTVERITLNSAIPQHDMAIVIRTQEPKSYSRGSYLVSFTSRWFANLK